MALRGSKWMVNLKASSKPETIWLRITTIPVLMARPSNTPMAADTSA